jgi:diguanylate cyclase (GGDEF)-like protein
VLGVLNLHHSTRADAFSEADLAFSEELAALDAQIIARAQEHEALRSQAARYAAVRRVQDVLGSRDPFPKRLTRFCRFVAEQAGGGIANLYLFEPDADELRLAATSLEGGGFGGEYRVRPGEGIDGTVASTREPAFLRGPSGHVAYAALPLVAGNAVAGVLSVQAGPGTALGRAAEETLLEISAAAAEDIVQSEREARVNLRANKVAAINETGIRMISVDDPAEVLRLGTSGAAMVLEADHAVLRLQDAETGRFAIRSYFGAADGRLQERLFRLDKRVSVDAIKRRAPVMVRDVADDTTLVAFDAGVKSLIAAPLKRDGRVIGTLAIYDKVASDRFYAGCFGDEDLQLFEKFTSYLERALANALFHAQTRQFRNFDEETGLPNEAYLHKRIHEEIARSAGREGSLALAICSIENLDEIAAATGGVRSKRVVQRTVEALRSHLRDFDVLGRTGPSEFTILMPDPGFAPGDRLIALARAVADDVCKDDELNDPLRIALAFGHAIYPDEAGDREALVAQARVARIRMV